MAKNAFNKRREIFSKRLNKELKKRVILTIVWRFVLYGSETLESTNEIDKKLLKFGHGAIWKISAGRIT